MKDDQAKEFEDEEEPAKAGDASLPETVAPGIPINTSTGNPKKKRMKKKDLPPPPSEEGVYVKNAAADHAKHIDTIETRFKVSLYHVYHLIDRQMNGNDDGSPRDGITEDVVVPIVFETVNHLIKYASIVKNFTWLNHGSKDIRVVCQKEIDGVIRNIPIEAHLIGFNHIEITIFTAMPFSHIRAGQYVVRLMGDDCSVLLKRESRDTDPEEIYELYLDKH